MQNPGPMIVTIVPQPERHVTIVDVLVGSFTITVLLVLLAVVLGGVLAYVLIQWHRRHPPEDDRLPPISPLVVDPRDRREARRASSPTQAV